MERCAFTYVTLWCDDGTQEDGFMWWDEMLSLFVILEPGCGYNAVLVQSARVPEEFRAFGADIK